LPRYLNTAPPTKAEAMVRVSTATTQLPLPLIRLIIVRRRSRSSNDEVVRITDLASPLRFCIMMYAVAVLEDRRDIPTRKRLPIAEPHGLQQCEG